MACFENGCDEKVLEKHFALAWGRLARATKTKTKRRYRPPRRPSSHCLCLTFGLKQ